MDKKLKFSKKLIGTIAAGLTFVLIGSGCSKSNNDNNNNVSLTKGLRGLSTVQTDEDGTECKVDEYIKSYLENLGTDMQTEEKALVTASIDDDKPAVNKAFATILTAELKAVIADALNVSESELLNFHVEGVYRKAYWDKDCIDEYAICFEYGGRKYSFKTIDEFKTWCFYIRAAEQGQIDNYIDSESYATFYDVNDFAFDALSIEAEFDFDALTMKLADGHEINDPLLGKVKVLTYDGKVGGAANAKRRIATRNGGNAA